MSSVGLKWTKPSFNVQQSNISQQCCNNEKFILRPKISLLSLFLAFTGWPDIQCFTSLDVNQGCVAWKVFYPGAECPSCLNAFPILLFTMLGTKTYAEDIAHFQASGEQNSTCAVNPSSVEDLSAGVSYSTYVLYRSWYKDWTLSIPGQNNWTRRHPCTFCSQSPILNRNDTDSLCSE